MLFAALSGDEITLERVGQHTGLECRLAFEALPGEEDRRLHPVQIGTAGLRQGVPVV